ncbi:MULTISPECIES: carbohydrate-binding protein [unclassified Enterococcus]|uniref:fibronectin type III domain-containing protein n=1 Tax=unclassified Enterococcus TaxID=2608891 RepID=UPI0013EA82BE|nr:MULTISPECIES: carbohydrate-binding protein [unclassified Enterococcus]
MFRGKRTKKLIVGMALSGMLIAPMLLSEVQGTAAVEQKTVAKPDFGVGQGIEWPEQVVAPYVDMTAYSSSEDLSNNGVVDLAAISKTTGQKFFKLAFMQARGVKNGRIDWAWGGFTGLSEIDNDEWQYEGIKKSIRELRQNGGDAAVSFGGLNSGAFWEVTQDEDLLYNAYMEVVQGYGLTRVDYDVEAAAMGYEENLANAKAVKRVQEATGVEVTLTLPVMDTGLISTGLDVLRAYLEAGVELTNLNLMTMCYGPVVPDYAQGSLDAVDNTMVQLKDYYRTYTGKTLTTEQAYAKLGTTPSIGFESEAHPYFTTEMFDKVVQHAKERKLGMVSYWSMNRDAKVDGGQGRVTNQYEFLNVAQDFVDDSEIPVDTEKPTPPRNLTTSGVTTRRATVNWSPATDNDRVAKYNLKLIEKGGGTSTATTSALTYSYSNLKSNTEYTVEITAEDRSGNVSDKAVIKFTTLKENESAIPEWNPATVYVAGDRVVHEGIIYEARYWTQNNNPLESGEWGPWRQVS